MIIPIVLFFLWISFFPQPIQAKYHLAINIFLALIFLIILFRKRIALFKLSDFSLWVFLAAISINIFFAQEKSIALKTYLDLAIPLFSIYYIVSESVTSTKKFLLLSKVIVIASSLVASLGILDILLGYNFLYEHFIPNPFYEYYKSTGVMRAISTQFHNPPLGSYLIASLPFSLLLLQEKRLSDKLLGWTGVILNSTAVIFTFSRGIFLGFIMMLLFVLFTNRQRKFIFLIFIFFGIFLCAYFSLPKYLNTLELKRWLYTHGGIFSHYRTNRVIMSFKVLIDHPFVGLGFQHFRILFYKYYPVKEIVPYVYMIADNMYLTLLAETGILGFTGFLIFIFSIFRKALKKIIIPTHLAHKKQQLFIVLSAFIGLLVSMAGYEFFYWPNQYIYFCILVGLMEVLWRDLTS